MTPNPLQPRLLSDHDRHLDECGFDGFELTTLDVARRFFASFARPETHGWIAAFEAAERAYPAPFGATIAMALVRALDVMRQLRRSPFDFVTADCPVCAGTITQEERHLIATLAAARRGRRSEAMAHATMLCEGERPEALVASFETLAVLLGEGPLA
ncbi:MAG: hypothetical protein AAGI51_00280 [Pseudomonadota bacterium]